MRGFQFTRRWGIGIILAGMALTAAGFERAGASRSPSTSTVTEPATGPAWLGLTEARRAHSGYPAPAPRLRDRHGRGLPIATARCTGAAWTATGTTPPTWPADAGARARLGLEPVRPGKPMPTISSSKAPFPRLSTPSRRRTPRSSRSASRRCVAACTASPCRREPRVHQDRPAHRQAESRGVRRWISSTSRPPRRRRRARWPTACGRARWTRWWARVISSGRARCCADRSRRAGFTP